MVLELIVDRKETVQPVTVLPTMSEIPTLAADRNVFKTPIVLATRAAPTTVVSILALASVD